MNDLQAVCEVAGSSADALNEHEVELPPKPKKKLHGATRHCCYKDCRSDSRYADRESMQGVGWVPFPKPKTNLAKCERWLEICCREGFTVDKVKKWTYICTKHFIGGNGPTEDYPDPIPANATPIQASQKLLVSILMFIFNVFHQFKCLRFTVDAQCVSDVT